MADKPWEKYGGSGPWAKYGGQAPTTPVASPQVSPQEYHSDLRKIPLLGHILGPMDEYIVDPAIQQFGMGANKLVGRTAPAEGESRTSQVLGGVSDLGRGAMTAFGPMLALQNPMTAAKAAVGGLIGEGVGRIGSALADLGPGTSQFMGDVGGLAGGYGGSNLPSPGIEDVPGMLKFIRNPLRTVVQAVAGALADHLMPPETPDPWGRFHAPSGFLPKPTSEVDPWGNFTPVSGMLPKQPPLVADPWGQFTPPSGMLPRAPGPTPDPWGNFTPPSGLLPKPIEMTDKFGKFTPQPIAKSSTVKPGTPESISPIEENPVMRPLQPIDKFEMNRMAHARAQELELPGSPAGKSAHPQLSKTAKDTFGVRSWSDLTASEMKQIHDFMDTHKRLPTKGEIKE